MPGTIPLRINGTIIPNPVLPSALRPAARSANGNKGSIFLPDGYVRIEAAFDVSVRGRSSPEAISHRTLLAEDHQVAVLEMADGVTVITSVKRLRDSLQRVNPDAADAEATLDLGALRRRGEQARGIIGDAVGDLVSRVFILTVGDGADPIITAAKRKAAEWVGDKAEEQVWAVPELGLSWLGTKALMAAIESYLDRKPGLYRWPAAADASELLNVDDRELAKDVAAGPLLLFIHGTASSSMGSFGAFRGAFPQEWQVLEKQFGRRMYAFEHHTLSQSPVDNALELARRLPHGARLNLVAHSRGGLIADLLSLENFSEELIESYRADLPEPGDLPEEDRERVKAEAAKGYAEHRARLRELRQELREKQFLIERYVRVACPARGTLLASGNFDVFLSTLLTLIGWVPSLYGNPLYYAFKRVVLEIAKNRTDPKLVPGIEAMLPDSPMARFLASATPQPSAQVAIIAGDIEGGGLLKRLGVLFTDFAFFNGIDNDLVVDTDSMYAGIARQARARALFDRGPALSHFHYFDNDALRKALCDWLTNENLERLELFKPLPGDLQELTLAEEKSRAASIRRSRGGEAAESTLPIVVVLPGIMGSHLWRNQEDRIWFDLTDMVAGGLRELRWTEATGTALGDGISAEKLFDDSYGALCEFLIATHRVERFPYDWRLPLNLLADRLIEFLRKLLDESPDPARPLRLLAHSMGGLVVRSVVHKNPRLWDELMSRDGARFVMLGTPNQGAHSMVEALIGKSDTLRTLARLDLANDLQSILDIIAEFRGALQLLPRPGFRDVGGAQFEDYYSQFRWREFKAEMKDFWFGNEVAGMPSEQALEQARWLWDRDGSLPALPSAHADKTIYVHGCAPLTACGIEKVDGRWKMIGTTEGDGTVTWVSGAIGGIGRRYYMPAIHGDLADTEEYFPAVDELLRTGSTGALADTAPTVRGAWASKTVAYEAGPPRYPMPQEVAHPLMGKSKRKRLRSRAVSTLRVAVKAMDLRFSTRPIMVGHYEQDAISGAEAIIDRDLVDYALSERYSLGLYAGPVGTAVVVLRLPNDAERLRGSFCGAVVTGLGRYDGTLAANTLTEAVRAGALRYLLQYADCSTSRSGDIPLGTLLMGYNSTANLTIAASVEALVRGVAEANRKFKETNKGSLQIGSLEIVEVYLDTAISAMRALTDLAAKMNLAIDALGVRLEVPPILEYGMGIRQRLDDSRTVAHWQRLIITDADAGGAESALALVEDAEEASARVAPAVAAPMRPRIAERLRFVYAGQRARAETVVQQRQPGLVEALVAQQVQLNRYQPDFCRTLFQLMVPQEFKDAARQLDRIALVVDGYTANLPWELMLPDHEPLAVRARVVRQLSSSRFRRQVRQAMEPVAYVVGNPSTENFFRMFPQPNREPIAGLDSLSGAEDEAELVAESLRRQGYRVEAAIGQGRRAPEVISGLYQRPYRFVHIAAHGVFQQAGADGVARTGVVLSDGLLLSAAEIGQMEIVPDLVFLNCCHLGEINPISVAYNRLAYSIARELIEIGVRCVVAAGWAVDDDAASTFAETFYHCILQDKLQFGEATFEARRETYRKHGSSMTWGAYQAYGDPGWRVDPRAESISAGGGRFVAVEELLDRLEQIRLRIYRRREALSQADAESIDAELRRLLSSAPKQWQQQADVKRAVAASYADLGSDYYERACKLYSEALAVEDPLGRAPISAAEQLANLESQLALLRQDVGLADRAIARLENLRSLAAHSDATEDGDRAVNRERAAIVASAYKRKAAIFANRVIAGDSTRATITAFNRALDASIGAYESGSETQAFGSLDPYPLINALALRSIAGAYEPGILSAAECGENANKRFMENGDVWSALMAAEAHLVECLCRGDFFREDASSEQYFEKVWQHYSDAMARLRIAPKHLDTVIRQLSLLALLFEARSIIEGQRRRSRPAKVAARRLRALAARLDPHMAAAAPAPEPSDAGQKAPPAGARRRTRRQRKTSRKA
jgi:CHAT domain-containing protein